ncbi:HNH endonuclease domain-containing protein [Xenorhabdus sp. XENO-7]|uniref:HNH endonuclease domain-containing protein n=1 Tax=Xenorhabdus aichiensis TaxID=3025874 RepID=A0ABT5MBI2_9GAMM|nr:HNH endonuclease [Xenorhabdus aichiensis]MDC9623592.1 HNH endonuclease domain-containing protein [Xenorhabdus aichiensis]
MADINEPISYSNNSTEFICKKKSNANFSHTQWDEENLKTVRKEIRDYYRMKQNGCCIYCRNELSITSPSNCHIEHIAPKSRYLNFIFEPRNLCVVCADCNTIKKDKEIKNECENTISSSAKLYPRSSKAFSVYHPHFDFWQDHIVKFNGEIYADLTDKGANTIRICRLNRRLRKFGINEQIISNLDKFHLMNKIIEENKIEKFKDFFK